MRIPKKVKVGGITYKIKYVDSDVNDLFAGDCDYNCSLLRISKSSKKQEKELTFLHELLHTMFYHCNLNQDEHEIEVLSHALHMVIKDNPNIFTE